MAHSWEGSKQDVEVRVEKFIKWLDRFGETSYDHQSSYAGDFGRSVKRLYYKRPLAGTLAVAPIIFCEAFVPSARRLFWKPQRFPIADAHYAMGFAYLARLLDSNEYYRRAVHFLDVLIATRSPGYEHFCWGYPFDWETKAGTKPAGIPMITSVAYMYEAFSAVYDVDKKVKWRDIMRSIADHAIADYHDLQISDDAWSCAYSPDKNDSCGVVNASAYRAFLLTRAAHDFGDERYLKAAQRNLRFVVRSQNPDGSWYYSVDGERSFVDHFHTCFVLKSLAKIEALTKDPQCTSAIERGIQYYLENLFDAEMQPKPFSRRPRLTVYRNELYDYAEAVNLCVLLRGRFNRLDEVLTRLLQFDRWQKADGSFRSRRLFLGWDNVPMHRWAQSQMFRSLCFYLLRTHGEANEETHRKSHASDSLSVAGA
jgi:hypothetical protein